MSKDFSLEDVLQAYEVVVDITDPNRIEYPKTLEVFLNALLGVDAWEVDDQGRILYRGRVYFYDNRRGRWVSRALR